MTTPAATALNARPADRRPPYVRWTFYLLCVCLVLLLAVAAGLVVLYLRGGAAGAGGGTGRVTGELRRDLAGKLLSAGLTTQAIEQYTLYLAESDLPPERRANLAYTIGKLCMDQGRYEEALAWLYQVDMLDPRTELAPEAGSKIVTCLEKLGRFAQAQYSLEARSGLDGKGKEEFKGGEVVAVLGKDPITLKDLDEAIDQLPAWMRDSFQDPARKEEFLQQYVAEELLVRKARRLEMDKDPALRKQAERAMRQLLVQKILEQEIRDKVKVTPADVELFYKGNLDKYREKEAFRIRMIKLEATRLPEVQAELRKGTDFAELAAKHSRDEATREKGGQVESWVEEGMDPTGIGSPARLWEALAGHGQGEICGPVTAEHDAFLFRIESHRPERTPALEEVKAKVEQDLARQRAEQAYQQLVAESLQASDVKLYPEVLRGTATGEGQKGSEAPAGGGNPSDPAQDDASGAPPAGTGGSQPGAQAGQAAGGPTDETASSSSGTGPGRPH